MRNHVLLSSRQNVGQSMFWNFTSMQSLHLNLSNASSRKNRLLFVEDDTAIFRVSKKDRPKMFSPFFTTKGWRRKVEKGHKIEAITCMLHEAARVSRPPFWTLEDWGERGRKTEYWGVKHTLMWLALENENMLQNATHESEPPESHGVSLTAKDMTDLHRSDSKTESHSHLSYMAWVYSRVSWKICTVRKSEKESEVASTRKLKISTTLRCSSMRCKFLFLHKNSIEKKIWTTPQSSWYSPEHKKCKITKNHKAPGFYAL